MLSRSCRTIVPHVTEGGIGCPFLPTIVRNFSRLRPQTHEMNPCCGSSSPSMRCCRCVISAQGGRCCDDGYIMVGRNINAPGKDKTQRVLGTFRSRKHPREARYLVANHRYSPPDRRLRIVPRVRNIVFLNILRVRAEGAFFEPPQEYIINNVKNYVAHAETVL